MKLRRAAVFVGLVASASVLLAALEGHYRLVFLLRQILDLVRLRLLSRGRLLWADALIDAMSPALTVTIWIGGWRYSTGFCLCPRAPIT